MSFHLLFIYRKKSVLAIYRPWTSFVATLTTTVRLQSITKRFASAKQTRSTTISSSRMTSSAFWSLPKRRLKITSLSKTASKRFVFTIYSLLFIFQTYQSAGYFADIGKRDLILVFKSQNLYYNTITLFKTAGFITEGVSNSKFD
jgi:hypothetical protein